MFGMARTGPIGLDFGVDTIRLVQTSVVKGRFSVRSAAVLPYTLPALESIETTSLELKKLITAARIEKGFKGNRVVVCMPPGKVQFVSLEYKCPPGEDANEAVLDAIRERLGERIGHSVIDYIQIRPEHKDQVDRLALVVVAEHKMVTAFLDLLSRSGLYVERLEIGPVAINRLICAINPKQNEKICMAINVGIKKSYVTVLWGRRILLDREISFGQETVLKQVSEALEVSPSEALMLLQKHGIRAQQAVPVGDDFLEPGISETISDILKPSLLKLSTEIKRLTLYIASRTRGREVSSAYIFGNAVSWPEFDQTLTEMTGIPLQFMTPFYGLDSNIKKTHRTNRQDGLAVATGLSLWGLEYG